MRGVLATVIVVPVLHDSGAFVVGCARSGSFPINLTGIKGRMRYQSSLIRFDLVRAGIGREGDRQ